MALTSPPAAPDAPPAIPARADDETFDDRADAAWAWLFAPFWTFVAAFRTWYSTAAKPELEALQADVTAKQIAAAASNAAAAVNAAAAAASAGATLWVNGTNYAQWAVVTSPTNGQTYKDGIGGVSSTDPAADTTSRWQSAMLPSAEAIGLPDMLPTAVFNFAGGVIDRRFVQGRTTATTRRNIFGNVESVAAGVALPDFDPLTKRCLGYRSNPAATYLAMYSEALDNGSYWVLSNVTVTPAAARGIDGALSAYKIEAATAAPTTYYRAAVATATTQYFVVRAAKGSSATDGGRFAAYNTTTAADLVSLTFNYDTGAITQSVGTGATAVPVGGGIWEIRIPVTSGISIGNNVLFYAGFTGAPESAGAYSYICAPQVSDKANQPYYPTAGSNLPRGADSLVLDLTAHTAIINPLQHTLVCAFNAATLPAAAGDHMVVNLSGGGGAEQVRINVYAGVVYAEAITSSVSVASLNLGAVVAGRNVVAFSVAANSFAAVARGGTLAADASGAVPAVTSLGVGCNPASAGAEPSAHIEVLAVLPRACTSGELRALVNNF